jgi:hypothetical protein
MLGDALIAPLLQGGRADEHRGAAAALHELAQELAVGLREDELHGALVRRLHLFQVLPEPRGVGVGARVELRRVLLVAALDVELHGGGIERRAVVELHALAELEGVGQRILRHRPRRRELRNQGGVRHVVLRQVLVDQSLVHLLAHPPRHPSPRAVGIEDVELALLRDDERAAALGLVLGRGARRHAETGQDRGGGGGGADLGACSDELPAADAPFDECGFDALERCP